MFLYVNGDSHAAGAEAVVSAAFAEDQGYPELGRQPHPENLKASWGYQLAKQFNCEFVCDAESAASNYRIQRTTKQWLGQLLPWDTALVIIGWSTWEREEWLIDNEYFQVGSSGIDSVPPSHELKYKEFVSSVNWTERQQYWHQQIWELHQTLSVQSIPHVFFNCNNKFDRITKSDQWDWGVNYIDPYGNLTYDYILKDSGFKTVNSNSWHFGKDAHCFWADFVLQYCISNNLVPDHAISVN
jgi:hypothetical protein